MLPEPAKIKNSTLVRREIDRICDAFEQAAADASRPRIEDHLEELSKDDRPDLFFELLKVEIEYLGNAGQDVLPDSYRQRFPAFLDKISAAFAAFGTTQTLGVTPSEQHKLPASDEEPPTGNASSELRTGDRIGKFRIVNGLGSGGFGCVYLAEDLELGRQVAVKVAHARHFISVTDAIRFRNEAQNGAGLSHPGITPVYSLEWDNRPPFIVQAYIEGGNLKERLDTKPISTGEAVRIVAEVAEAIAHAHQQGVYHRDLKPSNILLALDDSVRVADFGQSLRENDRRLHKGERCGTLSYMAPEQLRGESHRLDGRCDIWSLGVILYELLIGRLPFSGESVKDLDDEILHKDPRPPRQLNPTLPAEVERICLKCLCKRMTDRYTNASDLSGDLRRWLSEGTGSLARDIPNPSTRPPKVVPKGLRSFEDEDADFFLELLPGPTDHDGLPDVIRFWKTRIDQPDRDQAFSVGLIYGPSGSGKSSIVKAGLLPRLNALVLPVYVEATPHDTETRLLQELRKRFPGIPDDLELPELLADLREGDWLPSGHKILIVFDQFEQWLHANKAQENAPLVQALRQCDGGRVQCLVMVRDDFWMAVTRFLEALEIELVQGRNLAAVDRFDLRHAKKVLMLFGQAYGAIPQDTAEITRDQQAFLEQSVRSLADDGRVVSIRLAVFAEMVKGETWTPANLKSLGGSDGLVVALLDDTFSSPAANPAHRLHERAAQNVLNKLLPSAGIDIKGHMKSHAELLEASGYVSQRDRFDRLIRILDGDLRLITPTDPAHGQTDESESISSPNQASYQLTHDYLVPSLRRWLIRKQKETRQGRAELTLAERSALWSRQRERRYLPSAWEWVCIARLTDARRHSVPQRTMMRAATRYHTARIAAATLITILLGWATYQAIGYTTGSALVQKLRTAEIREVRGIVQAIEPYRRWANPLLQSSFESAPQGSRQRINTSLGLLSVDDSRRSELLEHMLATDPVTVIVLRDALFPYRRIVTPELWRIAEAEGDPARRFRAALGLAAYASPEDIDPRWKNLGDLLADQLLVEVVANVNDYKSLTDAIRPVSSCIIPSLRHEFRSPDPSHRRSMATNILTDFAEHDVELLAALAMEADAAQFRFLFPRLKAFPERAVAIFSNELSKSTSLNASDSEIEVMANRQANAAVGLYRFGRDERMWQTLRQRPDPRLRAYVIHRLQPLGANPNALAARITVEEDVSVLQALLLALGDFNADEIDRNQLQLVVAKATEMLQTHEDAGIHSASEWLLGECGYGDAVEGSEGFLISGQSSAGNWSITGEGHTMVIVDGHVDDRVGRMFEIATKEVTVAQFQRLVPEYQPYLEKAPTPDCPANVVSWYDAVAYCRRLNEVEGVSEDQMCFPPLDEMQEEIRPYPDYLSRTGYRLPTEAEWQLACRAGTKTKFFFGESQQLLSKYAWFAANSGLRLSPVGRKKPNDVGLFDMYGNAMEWCDDSVGTDRTLRGGSAKFRADAVSSWEREAYAPKTRFFSNGFRVARTRAPESGGETYLDDNRIRPESQPAGR